MNVALLIRVAKVLVAAAILALLVRYVDFADVSTRLTHAKPVYLFVAFVVLTLQITTASLRWIQLLRLSGYVVKSPQMIACFAAGSLINSLLPTGVAGDAMRIWAIRRDGIDLGPAAYSVLLDRVVAMLGLGLLTAVAAALGFMANPQQDMIITLGAIAIGAASVVAIAMLMLIAPLIDKLFPQPPRLLALARNLSRMAGSLLRLRGGSNFVVLTVIANVLMVVAALALAWSLGIALKPIDAAIGVPLALLITAVPLTPAGWGLREGAMAIVFARFGMDAAPMISMSILLGFFSILASLPAGMAWFFWSYRSGEFKRWARKERVIAPAPTSVRPS